MSQTKIQFPWYVLVDDEGDLLVVFSEDSPMVAVFTSREYADLYKHRSGSALHIGSVFGLDDAIAFLTGLSTEDPSGESDHITRICLDPIDPEGDEEGSAFEIETLLEGLRKAVE